MAPSRQDGEGRVREHVVGRWHGGCHHRGPGLRQITDTGAIEAVIDSVIAANPKQLADYRSGKDNLFRFFAGQVMKATGGKANPTQLNELLKAKLAGGGSG